MKRKTLSLVLASVVILTLMLAGSASANPPKEDFYFKWGPADYDLWMSAGGADFCPVQTGNAWHSDCGTWPWYVVGSTHPLVSGTYVWWVDKLNGFYYPESYGFWPEPQIHGGFRIQPAGIDGYWEGTFEIVDNWQGEYNHVISKMNGKGYGALDGLLIKGSHWFDPVEPGEWSPYGDFWPVLSGVIIYTGQAE